MSRLVFFNVFDAAELHISVKVTHGTPCTLIPESSLRAKWKFQGVWGQSQRICVGLKAKPKKLTIIKAAGKICVEFNDCMRNDII